MATKLISAVIFCALNAAPVLAADIFWTDSIEDEFIYAYPADTVGEPIAAGDFKYFDTMPHLRVEGPITPGDSDRLQAMLRQQKPDPNADMFKEVVVSFKSDGGDFYEGLAMADAISDFAVTTFVGPGDRCLSSCAIAFLGGSAVVMRGIPSWPSRYVHVDAVLGFHAPFSEIPTAIQIPDGTPLTNGLTQQMAQSFYGQAQAAINEIAGRISNWQISSDFVFQMLTKDSYVGDTRAIETRFVLIDSYAGATQIKANVLTSSLAYPTEITGIGANAACRFLVRANSGRDLSMFGLPSTVEMLTRRTVAPNGTQKAAAVEIGQGRYPEVVTEKTGFFTVRRLVPGNDPDAFFTEGLLSGVGPVQCSAFRGDDGRWYARTFNENIHSDGTYVRGRGDDLVDTRVLDFEKAYPISSYVLLGATDSWKRPPQLQPTDLRHLPDWASDIKGASFNCGGELDPAAVVICEFPALANADGRLGALYSATRTELGDVVVQEQRAWIRSREQLCRAKRVDLSDEIIRRNLARCLMEMTSSRNQTLAQQLQQ